MSDEKSPPRTPDGRYIIVRGRLWRATNPTLSEAVRERLVKQLMAARSSVGKARRAKDAAALARAGQQVDEIKIKLGERGPMWWDDGSPDFNRHLVKNTPYAEFQG